MLLPLSWVLAAALTAAPRPLPLPAADSGIFIPRLDKMGGTLAFMERAGEQSVMLRPSTWFADFHPLLYLDFTRADSLQAAGLDVASGATVSFRKDGRMTCVDVADARAFDARARERLATLGTLWEGKLSGVPVVAAKTPSGTFAAGYARKGNVSCAVLSSKDAQPLLKLAASAVGSGGSGKATGPWADLGSLSGEVFFISGEDAFGLSGDARALRVDGRLRSLPLPVMEKGQESPYAALQPTGLLVARAAVKPSELPGAVQSLVAMVAKVCSTCDREATAAIGNAIAAQLTGRMALAVQSLNTNGRLRTDAQRFAAARQVWLAEAKDPARLRKALAPLGKWKGAHAVDGGFAVPVDAGEVRVVLHGSHLLFANDAQSLETVKASLPSGRQKMTHAVELAVDPVKTSRALGRISLFDVMGSKELAGLFALATELGPLLSISQSVQGHADPDRNGTQRVGLVWTLK